MTIYLVYKNTVTAKIAVSMFFASLMMSRIISSHKNTNIQTVCATVGSPLGISPESGDTVYLIEIPIIPDHIKAMLANRISVYLLGQHNSTYEHFGIKDKVNCGVNSEISTPLLAYRMFDYQMTEAPSGIMELNKEIVEKKNGPLLRFYESLFPHDSKPITDYDNSQRSLSSADIGWMLLRNDQNDLTTFKKMGWGKPANFEDTLFVKGMAVKPLAMQHPGPNAGKLIKGILDDGDIDLIISWIITVERVTFCVYSNTNTALAICEGYMPTGTPWEAGFSMPVKSGLALISRLLAK